MDRRKATALGQQQKRQHVCLHIQEVQWHHDRLWCGHINTQLEELCHLWDVLKQVWSRELPEYLMRKCKAGQKRTTTLARLQQTGQNTQSGSGCPEPRSSVEQSMRFQSHVHTQFILESAVSYLPFAVYQTVMQTTCQQVLSTGQCRLEPDTATNCHKWT